MHILWCDDSKFCEISKEPFVITYKILNPNTSKYVFYEVIKVTKYNILKFQHLKLGETGPSNAYAIYHVNFVM